MERYTVEQPVDNILNEWQWWILDGLQFDYLVSIYLAS